MATTWQQIIHSIAPHHAQFSPRELLYLKVLVDVCCCPVSGFAGQSELCGFSPFRPAALCDS